MLTVYVKLQAALGVSISPEGGSTVANIEVREARKVNKAACSAINVHPLNQCLSPTSLDWRQGQALCVQQATLRGRTGVLRHGELGHVLSCIMLAFLCLSASLNDLLHFIVCQGALNQILEGSTPERIDIKKGLDFSLFGELEIGTLNIGVASYKVDLSWLMSLAGSRRVRSPPPYRTCFTALHKTCHNLPTPCCHSFMRR